MSSYEHFKESFFFFFLESGRIQESGFPGHPPLSLDIKGTVVYDPPHLQFFKSKGTESGILNFAA
jgi:hypothetical protein